MGSGHTHTHTSGGKTEYRQEKGDISERHSSRKCRHQPKTEQEQMSADISGRYEMNEWEAERAVVGERCRGGGGRRERQRQGRKRDEERQMSSW